MKNSKVWRDEFVEIKAYLSAHTSIEAMKHFNRSRHTIQLISKAHNYDEFDKFRSNRRHWHQPVMSLPKPMSWHKKTPTEKFNEEWYFQGDKK